MSLDGLFFGPGDDDRADVVRFGFFAVLAVDIWDGISHLARYGAGHFNVSHLASLDGVLPAPDRTWMVALALIQIVLAIRAALGIQLRVTVPALAALYSVSYFWSQFDSYQHHYLLCVLLGVLSGGVLLDGDGRRFPAWSLRLVMGVLAIMYFWAGVTKVDAVWLSGKALGAAMTDEAARQLVMDLAQTFDVSHLDVLQWASWAAMLGEFFLVVGLLWPRTRTVAWALGLAFHVGIEVVDLRIGLFSYFMVALYLLYAPAPVVRWLAVPVRWLDGIDRSGASWPATVGAAAVTAAVVFVLPLPGAAVAACVCAGAVLAAGPQGRSPALAQAIAVLGLLALHQGSDVARDYYKYWGGDTRRRGPLTEAIEAYESVVELDPAYASGRLRLGDLYLRAERPGEAVEQWREALAIEPDNAGARQRLTQAGATP